MALSKHDLEWAKHFLSRLAPISTTEKDALVMLVHRIDTVLKGKSDARESKTERPAA